PRAARAAPRPPHPRDRPGDRSHRPRLVPARAGGGGCDIGHPFVGAQAELGRRAVGRCARLPNRASNPCNTRVPRGGRMAKPLVRDIWIVGAKRTGFGAFGGALKDLSATDLAVHAAKAALAQSRVSAEEIDDVTFGNVQQTSADAIYHARHVGLRAGVPVAGPALGVNRLCGSGFQAVITGAEKILVGDAELCLVGGAENMTQAPHVIRGARQGLAFGRTPPLEDSLWTALTDSYTGMPMAITAENLAEKYGITRAECDAYALRSQRAWADAQAAGRFADEIEALELKAKQGPVAVDKDEHPRPDTTPEALAKLPPVFKKDGVVTAGNASGICDGAAALVLASREAAEKRGLKPLARLVQWGVAGCDPKIMGIG